MESCCVFGVNYLTWNSDLWVGRVAYYLVIHILLRNFGGLPCGLWKIKLLNDLMLIHCVYAMMNERAVSRSPQERERSMRAKP